MQSWQIIITVCIVKHGLLYVKCERGKMENLDSKRLTVVCEIQFVI